MSRRSIRKPVVKRRLLTVRETATVLGCSIDSIDRYLRAKKLPLVRLPSGHRRIDADDLDALIHEWKDR